MVASHDLPSRFRFLFDALPNGVMVVDSTGRIIQLNAQAEKMFGYFEEELIGQSIEVVVPVRFRRRHTELRKKFSAPRQMRPMGTGHEFFAVRKDGSEFPVEIGLSRTTADRRDIVLATIVDISERKRIADRNEVYDNARRRVQVCQQLGMPAAVLRQDGHVILTNQLFKQLHSQFLLRGEQIEVADPTENELFKRELSSLDRRNIDEIVYSYPIPASHDYPALICHLLPMESSFGNTFGILVVTTLNRADMPSTNVTQRLFSLTPAEARVAVLIGSGLSPREAATKLGISEGNVRTTLKHVFGKVGVSRQSELAVLLTTLALG